MNLQPRHFRSIVVVISLALVSTLGSSGPADASEDRSDTAIAIQRAVSDVGEAPAEENPAVELPMDGADSTTISGHGATLAFSVPATGQIEEATADGVLMAGDDKSVSIAVESTRAGARALIHLESKDAPERFEFPVEGDVTSLVLNQDGTVSARVAEGETIAVAQRPWAVDQTGRTVPTHYEIDGMVLIQVVEHRSGEFEYGITADPSWWWWTTNIAKCAAAVATTFTALGGVAKLAKIKSLINSNPKLKKAVKAAGGVKKFFTDLLEVARKRSQVSATTLARVKRVIKAGGATLLLAIGGSCWNIAREVA